MWNKRLYIIYQNITDKESIANQFPDVNELAMFDNATRLTDNQDNIYRCINTMIRDDMNLIPYLDEATYFIVDTNDVLVATNTDIPTGVVTTLQDVYDYLGLTVPEEQTI